ncbi:MAG: BspA family leucine-rich repeat surface protein [Clostridia bacterium]|nr:BspA family leucine-rich repeat surface protein [Clostridia bacterium]
MLILAGITINLTLGENGIFQKAKLAKGQYETASVLEKLQMEVTAMEVDNGSALTIEGYKQQLQGKINGISWYDRDLDTKNGRTYLVETAAKINGKVFVIYLDGNKIKIFNEENGSVMRKDTDGDGNDSWLDTGIKRNEIKTIQFISDIFSNNTLQNIEGEILEATVGYGVADITALGQEVNSVKCWWSPNTQGGYDIFIGGKDGKVIAPWRSASLFEGMSNLTTINFMDDAQIVIFDTSRTINMHMMFFGCSSLTSLDFSKCNFDTSNVSGSMGGMFYNCKKMQELNFGLNFDTSNVTGMDYMFDSFGSLAEDKTGILNLGEKFDTSKVGNMDHMFNSFSLQNLNFGTAFDTSKVTNMSWMFRGCKAKKLDFRQCNFDTSKVSRMDLMFYAAKAKEIYLGTKFNTANVQTMNLMFTFVGSEGTQEAPVVFDLGSFGVQNQRSITSDVGSAFDSTSTNVCNIFLNMENASWVFDISGTWLNESDYSI